MTRCPRCGPFTIPSTAYRRCLRCGRLLDAPAWPRLLARALLVGLLAGSAVAVVLLVVLAASSYRPLP